MDQSQVQTESTSLVILEDLSPAKLFSENGLGKIIGQIEKESLAIVQDISTLGGRREVTALAYKIARTKTTIDDMGKALVSEWKKKSKAVDLERKMARDRLDALKETIRKPLTDWENEEKDRIQNLEDDIKAIIDMREGVEDFDSVKIQERIHELKKLERTEPVWSEFLQRAQEEKVATLNYLNYKLESRLKYEEDQAELERLRKESEERAQKDREEQIRKDAEEKAKADAEADLREAERKAEQAKADAEAAKVKAEEEKVAAVRRQKDDAAAAKAASERASKNATAAKAKAKADAEAAKVKAKADAEVAKAKAKADAEVAKAKAKKDQEVAVYRERERAEREKEKEKAAQEKREANKKHKAKIDKEAAKALVCPGLSLAQAEMVICDIAEGDIPHVKMVY